MPSEKMSELIGLCEGTSLLEREKSKVSTKQKLTSCTALHAVDHSETSAGPSRMQSFIVERMQEKSGRESRCKCGNVWLGSARDVGSGEGLA